MPRAGFDRDCSAGCVATAMRMGCAASILCMAACASSYELIGKARAPITPDQVELYLEPPQRRYEQIAILRTSSKRSFSFTSRGKADVVIRRLKEEAARLGANGVLLRQITDESDGTIGTGAGTSYEGPRGTIDLGISVSALMLVRSGRGIAIFMQPDSTARMDNPGER